MQQRKTISPLSSPVCFLIDFIKLQATVNSFPRLNLDSGLKPTSGEHVWATLCIIANHHKAMSLITDDVLLKARRERLAEIFRLMVLCQAVDSVMEQRLFFREGLGCYPGDSSGGEWPSTGGHYHRIYGCTWWIRGSRLPQSKGIWCRASGWPKGRRASQECLF